MAANPKDSPRHYYTLDEYFALEHVGDARYEYWDGEIVCMSGGTLAHGTIAVNVIRAVASQLRGGRWRAFTADMCIKTPALPPYRYPDASVVCGEPKVENINGIEALLNPIVIVEILSPSTESRDRGPKLKAYQDIPSLQEYVLIAQREPRIIHYIRRPEEGWRAFAEITGMGDSVRLNSIDCVLLVSEVYERVTFSGAD